MFDYLTDQRDQVLCGITPMLMQPRFGELPEIDVGHRRYLCGSNGVFVEARSKHLHVRLPLNALSLPYGEITPLFEFTHGLPSIELLDACVEDAVAASPAEWAGLIIHDDSKFHYFKPPVEKAGIGHITYKDSRPDEELVIDIHSHGELPNGAYFSYTDDTSDIGCASPVFIAGVIAECNKANPTSIWRIVVGSHFFPLDELPFDMTDCGLVKAG